MMISAGAGTAAGTAIYAGIEPPSALGIVMSCVALVMPADFAAVSSRTRSRAHHRKR
jgi:hypothetical protein